MTEVLELHYYTDGACPGNGTEDAIGGMGVQIMAVAMHGSDTRSMEAGSLSVPWNGSMVDDYGDPTNQKCELLAVNIALAHLVKSTLESGFKSALKEMESHHEGRKTTVRVFSDSKYCVDGINHWLPNWKKNDWKNSKKKPVKNQKIWKSIDDKLPELNRLFYITYHHVPGHSGVEGNEEADRLAREATEPQMQNDNMNIDIAYLGRWR